MKRPTMVNIMNDKELRETLELWEDRAIACHEVIDALQDERNRRRRSIEALDDFDAEFDRLYSLQGDIDELTTTGALRGGGRF